MDTNKNIFPYHNGAADVFGDPLCLHRQLTGALGGLPEKVLADSESSDPAVFLPAFELLVRAVRDVFKLVPFNEQTGEGATEELALDTLDAFMKFLDSKKKPAASSPTSSPPTAPSPA